MNDFFYIGYTNIYILEKVKISLNPAMQRLHGLLHSWEQHPGNSWSRTKAVQDLGAIAVTFPAQLQHCSDGYSAAITSTGLNCTEYLPIFWSWQLFILFENMPEPLTARERKKYNW